MKSSLNDRKHGAFLYTKIIFKVIKNYLQLCVVLYWIIIIHICLEFELNSLNTFLELTSFLIQL